MRPDYAGGSLVNLIASIVAARGGHALHSPLKNLRHETLHEARNLVLLMIDGLGDNYLMRRGAGGALARRRRASMTSVFPSTTASAITTSYTGRTPLEHGLTGWFQYFGEAGCVSAALPFRSRGDLAPLAARGVSAERVFDAPSLFASLPVASYVVTYRDIVDSDYNTVHCRGAERLAYESVEQLVAQTVRAVKSSDARKFVYAYWPHYDAASHRFGCESPQALRELSSIDAAFGRLIAQLSGTETAILTTADHGFIDVAPEESFEFPSYLNADLKLPLCGERRGGYCHRHSPKGFFGKRKKWPRGAAAGGAGRQALDAGR